MAAMDLLLFSCRYCFSEFLVILCAWICTLPVCSLPPTYYLPRRPWRARDVAPRRPPPRLPPRPDPRGAMASSSRSPPAPAAVEEALAAAACDGQLLPPPPPLLLHPPPLAVISSGQAGAVAGGIWRGGLRQARAPAGAGSGQGGRGGRRAHGGAEEKPEEDFGVSLTTRPHRSVQK